MSKAILQNYLTSFFGILAGLPIMVAGSGLVLDSVWQHALNVIGGMGIVGLGVVAKAFNVHSTTDQAAASQAKAVNDPNAPALIKAADKVAVG